MILHSHPWVGRYLFKKFFFSFSDFLKHSVLEEPDVLFWSEPCCSIEDLKMLIFYRFLFLVNSVADQMLLRKVVLYKVQLPKDILFSFIDVSFASVFFVLQKLNSKRSDDDSF